MCITFPTHITSLRHPSSMHALSPHRRAHTSALNPRYRATQSQAHVYSNAKWKRRRDWLSLVSLSSASRTVPQVGSALFGGYDIKAWIHFFKIVSLCFFFVLFSVFFFLFSKKKSHLVSISPRHAKMSHPASV